MDEWIKKVCDRHTQNRLLFSHEKRRNPALATWVDPEGLVPSEISQTEKAQYYMISHIVESIKLNSKHKEQIGSCQKWQMGWSK